MRTLARLRADASACRRRTWLVSGIPCDEPGFNWHYASRRLRAPNWAAQIIRRTSQVSDVTSVVSKRAYLFRRLPPALSSGTWNHRRRSSSSSSWLYGEVTRARTEASLFPSASGERPNWSRAMTLLLRRDCLRSWISLRWNRILSKGALWLLRLDSAKYALQRAGMHKLLGSGRSDTVLGQVRCARVLTRWRTATELGSWVAIHQPQ
jgi:hypothetical protein